MQASPDKPETSQLWQAITVYLEHAYGGPPTPAVQRRIDQLRSAPEEKIYESPVFELDSAESPTRYYLRLGHRRYPNMKLVTELCPDGGGYLFRVDTHDAHGCPEPDSPDYEAYRALMAMNQELAQKIEAAWGECGLLTFKTYLRDDLARRRNA